MMTRIDGLFQVANPTCMSRWPTAQRKQSMAGDSWTGTELTFSSARYWPATTNYTERAPGRESGYSIEKPTFILVLRTLNEDYTSQSQNHPKYHFPRELTGHNLPRGLTETSSLSAQPPTSHLPKHHNKTNKTNQTATPTRGQPPCCPGAPSSDAHPTAALQPPLLRLHPRLRRQDHDAARPQDRAHLLHKRPLRGQAQLLEDEVRLAVCCGVSTPVAPATVPPLTPNKTYR
jgi:hypothetical protein